MLARVLCDDASDIRLSQTEITDKMSHFSRISTNRSLLHDVAMMTWTPHSDGEYYLVSRLIIVFLFLSSFILDLPVLTLCPGFSLFSVSVAELYLAISSISYSSQILPFDLCNGRGG